MSAQKRNYGGFPVRLFVGGVAVVSIALVVSAVYGYTAMVELRSLYLQERAQQVETYLTDRVRGPDRLDPERWRLLIEDTLQTGPFPWLKRAAIIGETGRELAVGGAPSDGLYQFDAPVHGPGFGYPGGRFRRERNPEYERPQAAPKLTLRIGIEPSSADFITRQAYLHLIVAVLAVFTLAGLAYSLLRTLRGFLALQAREESQRHLAALGTMSATLAHEIRNPLGAIKGLSQITQERLPEDHDAQELITTVVSEAERLERLVTDLLSFARPRELKPAELDLRTLVREVADGLRGQASEKQVEIRLPDVETDLPVVADPDGLRQVFYNVMINALDASPPGGAIKIEIDQARGDYLVSVSDEGSGLPKQDPEELFQPFVTTKTRGTGLGLPVSRQILERFGGRITLENRQPRGATCRIVISSASPRETRLRQTSGTTSRSHG